MERLAREELLHLLHIPSPSGAEERLLSYLETRFRALGLETGHLPVPGSSYDLLVNPLTAPRLLIDTHVDTVPDIIEGQDCPVRVQGDAIYGRGSADAKGSLVAVILAVEMLRQKGRPVRNLPMTLAFTVDEEREARGSEVLADSLAPLEAVVMEPTGLTVAVAEAGSLVVEVTVTGIRAHGSCPDAGESAISRTLAILERIHGLPFVQERHPLVGPADFNVRYLCGGSEELAVAGLCRALLDFRLLPGQDVEAVKRELGEFLVASGVTYRVVETSPPYQLPEGEPVVRRLRQACRQALGQEGRIGGMVSWTDAENLFSRGIPAVVFGPGRLEVAHTPDESVNIREIVAAARVLVELALSL